MQGGTSPNARMDVSGGMGAGGNVANGGASQP